MTKLLFILLFPPLLLVEDYVFYEEAYDLETSISEKTKSVESGDEDKKIEPKPIGVKKVSSKTSG